MLDGHRRLDAHPPQQLELGFIFRQHRPEQCDVGGPLDHLRLADVEEDGLTDPVPCLGQRQEILVPTHLLPRDTDLRRRLKGIEVLSRYVRGKRDAGAGDVLVRRPL